MAASTPRGSGKNKRPGGKPGGRPGGKPGGRPGGPPAPDGPTEGSGRWVISFGVGTVFLGCVIAAFAFMVITFAIASGGGGDDLALFGAESAFRIALTAGGLSFFAFLLVGPTLAFGLGWLLRRQANGSLHVIAFGGLGVAVGLAVGLVFGDTQLALLLGPMVGASAAVARMVVAPLARV